VYIQKIPVLQFFVPAATVVPPAAGEVLAMGNFVGNQSPQAFAGVLDEARVFTFPPGGFNPSTDLEAAAASEQSGIRFSPRTLNLSSKGNWVSVGIQLPGDLDEHLIDINSVRITEIAVDGFPPKAVEIFPAPGAPWHVVTNDMGVQVLRVKFIRYNKKGGPALDDQSLIYQLKSIMTGATKGKYPVTLTIGGVLTTGELFTGTVTFDAKVTKKLQ
jgi:hypothetical protein